MAISDRLGGPKICMPVEYNNSGALVSGMIYAVRANGNVDICIFTSSGASAVTNIPYAGGSAPPASGQFSYVRF